MADIEKNDEEIKDDENVTEDDENVTENNEANEDAVTTEEDKRINYAHDDIIEMLRKIEDMVSTFDTRFDKVEDALAMFVENGAIIRESDEVNIPENSDLSDFVDIDNLDLAL